MKTNDKAIGDSRSAAASTRRRFMLGAGAAMSAPLALTAEGVQAFEHESAGLKARLASLEDLTAIQELNSAYLRHYNAGADAELAGLFVDPAAAQLDPSVTRLLAAETTETAEQAAIQIAADRSSAALRLPCLVEIETAIEAPESSLIAMARLQGEGLLRTTAARVLELSYVNRGGRWRIGRVALAQM
jgi:hypothetical protein